MRTSRLFRLMLLVCSVMLVAGACGDDDDGGTAGDGGDGTTTTGAAADVDVVSSGQLTVCSDIPYEPFEFEGDDGEHTGYDIEIMREIATDLGLDLSVQVTPFEGILGSLAAGDCDVVASALTITEERAEQVDFSDPYYETDQSLMVKADRAEEVSSLDATSGLRIGVQASTTGADYATENAPTDATIVELPGAAELFSAIESNDIDAILQDEPVNRLRTEQDTSLTVVETFQTDETYGFAVEKGNTALLDAINDSLAELESSGRLDEIFEQFFG